MIVFKSNEKLSKEEWERWENYIESHKDKDEPILLPDFIDIFEFEEGEETEYEEE